MAYLWFSLGRELIPRAEIGPGIQYEMACLDAEIEDYYLKARGKILRGREKYAKRALQRG